MAILRKGFPLRPIGVKLKKFSKNNNFQIYLISAVLIRPISRNITSIDDLESTIFRSLSPLGTYRPPAKDFETLRLEKIESLKTRDVVFRKRMEQFAIFRSIKKAPVFDDEKRVEEMNVPKTMKIRDRRQLMGIVENERMNKPNPYRPRQLDLNNEVRNFVEEQVRNSNLYNG